MNRTKRIWIIVLVKRGFIEEPEIFFKKSNAQNRKKALMSCFNPDYDEIEIFEKNIAFDSTPL